MDEGMLPDDRFKTKSCTVPPISEASYVTRPRMEKLKGNQNVRDTVTGEWTKETERNDPERVLETDKPKFGNIQDLVSPGVYKMILLSAKLERLHTEDAEFADRAVVWLEITQKCQEWLK